MIIIEEVKRAKNAYYVQITRKSSAEIKLELVRYRLRKSQKLLDVLGADLKARFPNCTSTRSINRVISDEIYENRNMSDKEAINIDLMHGLKQTLEFEACDVSGRDLMMNLVKEYVQHKLTYSETEKERMQSQEIVDKHQLLCVEAKKRYDEFSNKYKLMDLAGFDVKLKMMNIINKDPKYVTTCYDKPITNDEIIRALIHLKSFKSIGSDYLPIEALKCCLATNTKYEKNDDFSTSRYGAVHQYVNRDNVRFDRDDNENINGLTTI